MKTQNINKKLQDAYEAMVEHTKSLIENENKSLKEALAAAEEKLSTMTEITKEEALKISDEVKSDLKSIGETLQGASDAYKEQFKLDAAYITDSVWEKLSKVADVGTEEFMEFTQDLKEKVQKIRTEGHASEHQDHLNWQGDHEFWLDEIEFWKKDHQRALEKLQAIEVAIKKHSDELEEHAQVIRAHEVMDHQHEEVMANNEIDPSSRVIEEDDDKEASIHEQEREEHAKHAELHDYLKKHHRSMMSMINHLYKHIVD